MSDSSYCCQKNIYCWARTETRTFTSTDTHMRSHIYTLTYPEVLITEHQRWKQNSVHVRGSRSFCSLQAVGFSVVAFIFSCCESKTMNRTGTKAEMETEEALHPLLETSKACIHKTDQSPSALYGHLLLPFPKWNDCFAIVMKRVHVLLGAATWVKCPPPLYFAVRT